jgi:hypothetical protein
MKTKILITLLVMFLLSASFGSRVGSAESEPAYPRSYFNRNDLDYLRALRTTPSHQAIWNNIKSWADAHINDSPPSGPNWTEARKVKQYLEYMGFAYAMTEDPVYAEAAKRWMLSVAGWSSWGEADGMVPSIISMGMSFGYDVLYDYLTASERDIIRTAIIKYMSPIYEDYEANPDWAPSYPNSVSTTVGGIGLAGLVLEGEYAGATDWINFASSAAQSVLDKGGTDGSWLEGAQYAKSLEYTIAFFDALKRVKGQDLFDNEFLRQLPYYFIYLSYNGNPLQFEDCFWSWGLQSTYFTYKLASEYKDGYAQWLAEAHIGQSIAQGDAWKDVYARSDMYAFIWKDPNVVATPPTSLPLTRHFRDLGYVIFRTGWGENDLLFAFKSGTSQGHAHPSQNEFGIYYQGEPITCGPGYVSGTDFATTWTHNCLLVDGKGQGQEPGDHQSLPLGTTGVIEQVDVNDPYYRYVLGDASAVYNGQSGNGDLDEWLRHVVFVENPNYFVIYDYVKAPAPSRFDWLLNSTTLSIDGSTITVDNGALNTVIIEPSDFLYEMEHYQLGEDWYVHDYDCIKVRPPVEGADTKFLTVHYPPEEAALSIEKVSVGNLIGAKIVEGRNLYLILFSADGEPVNEYIELGGSYRAADGGSYIFEGTGVRAQFDSYQVMKLRRPLSATQLATICAVILIIIALAVLLIILLRRLMLRRLG